MKGQKFGGRKKGTPNKTTALLKDAILEAAATAGGEGGLEGYLASQAISNPGAFMSLLGKVLPMQVNTNIGVSDPLMDLFKRIAENGKSIHEG